MVYKPDIAIDNEMLTIVSEISVLIDRVPGGSLTSRSLKLRNSNRIRSIQSSLAIEGNRLSLDDVTDIVSGKRVAGNSRDIAEVKNAKKAYDHMGSCDPFSADDLLKVHGIMMNDIIGPAGEFRDCGVGVYKGGVAVHIAPEYEDVPFLVNDLMDWGRDSDLHPLIKSCIFHCRFEYIHPFVDGNGRMGRLWHTLILSKWKPVFSYLPIENWINMNRREYYNSLTESDKGNVSVFVKFMLLMIREAVDELVDEITCVPKDRLYLERSILKMIANDPSSTAAGMADALGVNERTIRRHLSSMTERGMIKRTGSDKTGRWEIV